MAHDPEPDVQIYQAVIDAMTFSHRPDTGVVSR